MGNVNMEAYQVHFEGKSVAEKLKELDETVKENEQEIDSLSDIVSIKADRIDIAPIFSEESAYSAGDLVYNSNSLWKFSVDHAAGDWDPSEVSAVNIDMELSELKNTFTYDNFSLPAFSYAAGSVGTYIDTLTVNAAKTGYRIVSVTLTKIDHAGDYTVKLSAFNNTTIYAYLYRTSNSAGNYSAGDMTIRVLYQKI